VAYTGFPQGQPEWGAESQNVNCSVETEDKRI